MTLKYDYDNSTPGLAGMLITDYSQIDQLRCPNPKKSADLARTLEVIEFLQQRVGGERLVIGAAIASFSLPSMLMGTAAWMRLLYTTELRQRYFARIIEVCIEFVTTWANAQLQAGAHAVVLADGMASATLIPRPVFEQHALPVIKHTVPGINGFVAYEAVGRVDPFVDLLADVGAVALLVGEEDRLPACKRLADGKVALIGNLNNMKLRRWSPARVELQAKLALKQGMPGYGFALANQGPEIPFDTPVENIAALASAVSKYGSYERAAATAASC